MSQVEKESATKSWGIWLIRIILGLLTALVFGFIGLDLVFSDLGPGESDLARNVTTVSVFIGGGFITGLLVGRRLWPLAVLSSWGAVLIGVVAMNAGIDRLFTMVLPPLLMSLLGGYASFLTAKVIASRRRAG